jgi:hypothetical protein
MNVMRAQFETALGEPQQVRCLDSELAECDFAGIPLSDVLWPIDEAHRSLG